jgi:hypothetical protein
METGELLKRAKSFGDHLGLACRIPYQEEIVDHLYFLFVSYPDRIETALGNGKMFIPYEENEQKAFQGKEDFEKRGFHTHLADAFGNGTGKITRRIVQDQVFLVEILFHEGFHRNEYNKDLPKMLQEPCAYAISIQAAVEFFNFWGPGKYIRAARKRKRKFSRQARKFQETHHRRQEELRRGKVIDPKAEDNNAKLLSDSHCFLYYSLAERALRRIGFLGEARKFFTRLPHNLEEAKRRLEEIIQRPYQA